MINVKEEVEAYRSELKKKNWTLVLEGCRIVNVEEGQWSEKFLIVMIAVAFNVL